jgi:hypothetical protein
LYGLAAAGSNGVSRRGCDERRSPHRSESMDDLAEISRQLVELRIEHRDLDTAIAQLAADPRCDELHLRRLKKRKLRLKDMIAYLENKLIPDLDA